MNLANVGCAGHNELCKNNHTPTGVQFKTGDGKELDYMKSNNFTPNNRIGEPKVSADKEQNPNYSDISDNESHGGEIPCELFFVTGKDSGLIDIESMFDDDKLII